MPDYYREPSSFKDEHGFVFQNNKTWYRCITPAGLDDYTALMKSGLYDALIARRLLIPHTEVATPTELPEAALIIQPQQLSLVTYPYEWTFAAYKQAALATLAVQRQALEYGMSLKDASAYNIQIHNGTMMLIDTLSFERYQSDSPWLGYRQFVEHFLGPLALMSLSDMRLQRLMLLYPDGIPLDLVSAQLPRSSWLRFGLLSHVHLHARLQASVMSADRRLKPIMTKSQQYALLQGLSGTIRSLNMPRRRTEWSGYYTDTNYSKVATVTKQHVVANNLRAIGAVDWLWDMGANTGMYTDIARPFARHIIATDIDYAALNSYYQQSVHTTERGGNVYHLVVDMAAPSPAIGWAHSERRSLLHRVKVDVVMALALVHHLAATHHIRFWQFAELCAATAKYAIVEFVPLSDSQMKRLPIQQAGFEQWYHRNGFEQAFMKYFSIVSKTPIQETERVLYVFKKK